MKRLRFHVLALALVVLAGCAHTQPTEDPPAEAPVPRSVCQEVPELAAKRLPSPDPQAASCEESVTACNRGDRAGCSLAGACMQVRWESARKRGDATELLAATLAGFRAACEGGYASSCLAHAGVRQESGTPEKDTCAEVIRACQLGEGLDVCLYCQRLGCDG